MIRVWNLHICDDGNEVFHCKEHLEGLVRTISIIHIVGICTLADTDTQDMCMLLYQNIHCDIGLDDMYDLGI